MIVRDSVKGGVTKTGRRMAVTIPVVTAGRIAAQSSSVAFKVVTSGGVGIAPVIAEYATTMVLKAFGVNDPTAIVVGGAVSSVFAGVVAGAVVGGPVGAAVGGAVGAASWLIGQGISGLFHALPGPSENWCYIVKASISPDVSLKTYNANDGLYWISYWSSNTGDFSTEKVMSAGQPQDGSFQLTVGSQHFNEVFFQDTIFVGKDTCGKHRVCHCKGSFNTNEPAGTCDCHLLK